MDPFYLAILLYFVAVVLALVDLLVPSGGLLLILAMAAGLASTLFGFRSSTTMGMAMLTLLIVSVPILIYTALRVWPHTPLGRRIILGAPGSKKRPASAKKEGEQAEESGERKAASSTTANARAQELEQLVDTVHILESPLLPSGHIKIGHKHFNAVAESGFVDAQQAVVVVAVKERNLIVRKTDRKPSKVEPSKELEATEAEGGGNLLDLPADQLGLDSIDEN